MKQSFFEKLREVRIKDLFHMILFIFALPLSWFYRRIRPHMWLLCENGNEARDNAYWLFRYIEEEHPQQDAVYAIHKKSTDYKKVRNMGEVIEFGSFRHWIYYLAAEKNISTQKNGKPNAAVCYLLEVYGIRKNARIFLQHGVIINDLEFLHYKNAKMSMFMCSTQREYDFIKEKFGYSDDSLRLTGLCRFDNLHYAITDFKLILIMPTWRGWISPPSDIDKMNRKRREEFVKTQYYREWQGLLEDENLIHYIEENNYRIIFYPHREMQKFGTVFCSKSHHIKIADEKGYDVQKLLMKAALLVTDYSSVSMDFAYMKKPQIYFQFDVEKFRREHYAEGYFSYVEDGFGPVCQKREEVLTQIEHYGNQHFTNDAEYRQRQDGFFALNDSNNCKRNYEAIREF